MRNREVCSFDPMDAKRLGAKSFIWIAPKTYQNFLARSVDWYTVNRESAALQMTLLSSSNWIGRAPALSFLIPDMLTNVNLTFKDMPYLEKNSLKFAYFEVSGSASSEVCIE